MSDDAIKQAIQKMAGTHLKDEVYVTRCSVNSYDPSTRTVDCSPIDGSSGTDIPNVQLMADVDDGFLLVPEIGSTVIVNHSKYGTPYVSLFSGIASRLDCASGVIQYNDGSFGGLTKTLELQTQLDKTNQLLTAILDIINGVPIDEPGSGAPSALQAALRAALSGQELGDYSQIENTRITHGI
jgi:hypothetical protein